MLTMIISELLGCAGCVPLSTAGRAKDRINKVFGVQGGSVYA
jgi:hypothetical protein